MEISSDGVSSPGGDGSIKRIVADQPTSLSHSMPGVDTSSVVSRSSIMKPIEDREIPFNQEDDNDTKVENDQNNYERFALSSRILIAIIKIFLAATLLYFTTQVIMILFTIILNSITNNIKIVLV